MILSILICSLQSRSDQLSVLLENLSKQKTDQVDILTNIDNRQKSTGEKRNELLAQAQGDYIVFIDDDDFVPDYYIEEMINGCVIGADCMAINGEMSTNGRSHIKWKISKDYQNVDSYENGQKIYLRKTNHITAVRRELALRAGFPNKSNAEDKEYSERLNSLLKTEYRIEKPMYHYVFSTLNKQYK